jgi:hypothetical protein
MRGALLVVCCVVAAAACESPEERKAKRESAARAKVDAGSERAQAVAATPSTGRWDDAQLLKRLVDAGLAPQKRDSVKAQPWMGVPVLAYQLGNATIDAYVYRDSTARKDAIAKLDPITFAPRGQPTPWGTPREVVQNANLVAIVVGGTDRQRDRITTALAAGLGGQ